MKHYIMKTFIIWFIFIQSKKKAKNNSKNNESSLEKSSGLSKYLSPKSSKIVSYTCPQYKESELIFYFDKVMKETSNFDLKYYLGPTFNNDFLKKTAFLLKSTIKNHYTLERKNFFLDKEKSDKLKHTTKFSLVPTAIPILGVYFSTMNIDLLATTKFFIPYLYKHTRNRNEPIYHLLASIVLISTDFLLSPDVQAKQIEILLVSYVEYMIESYKDCFYTKKSKLISKKSKRKGFLRRFFPIDILLDMTRLVYTKRNILKRTKTHNPIAFSTEFSQVSAEDEYETAMVPKFKMSTPSDVIFLNHEDFPYENGKPKFFYTFPLNSHIYVLTGLRTNLKATDVLSSTPNENNQEQQTILNTKSPSIVQPLDFQNSSQGLGEDFHDKWNIESLIFERERVSRKKIKN